MDDRQRATQLSDAISMIIGEHLACEWEEVPPCVWCKDHNVRLYHGELPDNRLSAEVRAKRETCEHQNHETYDDGEEVGQGFYYVCADCGFKGWYE